jgi:hypothetical protein
MIVPLWLLPAYWSLRGARERTAATFSAHQHARAGLGVQDDCIARRCFAMFAPWVVEHTGLGAWVRLEVLEHVAVAAADEARQPILDVSGVTGFWHLAVVDDVEAHLQLPVNNALDCMSHLFIESGRVEGQSVLAREHELFELL